MTYSESNPYGTESKVDYGEEQLKEEEIEEAEEEYLDEHSDRYYLISLQTRAIVLLLGGYLVWESLYALSAWRIDPLKYIESNFYDNDFNRESTRNTAVTLLDDFKHM